MFVLMRRIVKGIYGTFVASNNPNVREGIITAKNLYVGNHQFITLPQMIEDTIQFSKEIPSDFDIVVAIPRSGLLVGNILASLLGKPLSVPDLYVEGKIWRSAQWALHNRSISQYNHILLVDESGDSLSQLNMAVQAIKKFKPDVDIKTAVLYIHKHSENKVDYSYKSFSDWNAVRFDINLMHGDEDCGGSAYDLDGVLCEDWNPEKGDYLNFLKNAKPYRIPVYPIKCIITARKEKYREITEIWLKKYNVRYDKLYMMPDSENDAIKFKTKALLSEMPYRYIESSDIIARECYFRTGIKCIALDTGKIYSGMI